MDVLRIVDLVAGIVFIFLLVATLCSAIREGIEAKLKTRAAYLERGIRELLDDREGGLTKQVFNHPQLFGLFMGKYTPKPIGKSLKLLASGAGLPSYVPARNFALALLDIAARGADTTADNSGPASPTMSVASIRQSVLNIDSPGVRRVLLTALDTARGDLDLARKNLEDWFNSSMDRVSGWYKRSTQWIVFVIAIGVTVGVNIDTLALTNFLYHDQAARTALATSAEDAAKKAPNAEEAAAALQSLDLPIGWGEAQVPHGTRPWVNRVLGWLITVLAATLGAPFWFDVLNQVMVIRSTVKPQQKSPNEASDDPQPRPPPAAPPANTFAIVSGALGTQLVPLSSALSAASAPEAEADGCGATHGPDTADEDLPAASGGVVE
jgi:hypothetical protein